MFHDGINCHIVLCTYPVESTKLHDNDDHKNNKKDDDDDDVDGRSSSSGRHISSSGKSRKSRGEKVLIESLMFGRNNVRTII